MPAVCPSGACAPRKRRAEGSSRRSPAAQTAGGRSSWRGPIGPAFRLPGVALAAVDWWVGRRPDAQSTLPLHMERPMCFIHQCATPLTAFSIPHSDVHAVTAAAAPPAVLPSLGRQPPAGD